MTDEELIARLRDDSGNWLTDAAADRIEALQKALKDQSSVSDRLAEQLAAARRDAEIAEEELGLQEEEACMMENSYLELKKERDALDGKLTKAVELALKECPFRWGTPRYDKWWQVRRTIIAELTGGKDE